MPPDKRRAPPAGNRGAPLKNIALGSGDNSEGSPSTPRDQARHRASFARDAVFAEFGYCHARALDYDAFVDRTPAATPVWWRP